jgi:hypothetical protein
MATHAGKHNGTRQNRQYRAIKFKIWRLNVSYATQIYSFLFILQYHFCRVFVHHDLIAAFLTVRYLSAKAINKLAIYTLTCQNKQIPNTPYMWQKPGASYRSPKRMVKYGG